MIGMDISPMEEEWDYMIVLDACRYDYFEKTYRDYIDGGLLFKVTSPGTSTPEWGISVFTGEYDDVVYVSGNTYIRNDNASGSRIIKDLRDTRPAELSVSEEHFHRIIDVWYNRWDDGTVHPKDMNKAALYALKKYPNKRLIIHYMQPHAPYKYVLNREEFKFRVSTKVFGVLTGGVMKIFGNRRGERILRSMNIPVLKSPIYKVKRDFGVEGARRVYEDNLIFVLDYVAEIIRYLKGKVVITADHGELLWDDGEFGHGFTMSEYPEDRPERLVEVPWLELDIDRRQREIPERIDFQEPETLQRDEDVIKDRLKALGYFD